MEENNIDRLQVITDDRKIASSVINRSVELNAATPLSRANDADSTGNAVAVPTPQLMRVTPQYLVDIINHIAQTDHRKPLLEPEAARLAVEKYKEWRKRRQPDEHAQPEYCDFAAFLAFEMVNGPLAANLPGERLRLALELISHVILEHGLLDRIWKVEYDLRGALQILTSASGSAERLLETFRVQRQR